MPSDKEERIAKLIEQVSGAINYRENALLRTLAARRLEKPHSRVTPADINDEYNVFRAELPEDALNEVDKARVLRQKLGAKALTMAEELDLAKQNAEQGEVRARRERKQLVGELGKAETEVRAKLESFKVFAREERELLMDRLKKKDVELLLAKKRVEQLEKAQGEALVVVNEGLDGKGKEIVGTVKGGDEWEMV